MTNNLVNIKLQTKTLSASKVKNTFGQVVNQVRNGTYNAVIVENHGEPVVAIVSFEELESMRALKEQEKRKIALTLLRVSRNNVQARLKKKLTDARALKFAQ